jgi:YbgC/YbaW family acyl-CoA thioester hydrolase
MERIKLQLPNDFSFSTPIFVRITDVNYGGHVGNDTFLSYIHQARVNYLQSLGFSELNVNGISLIMADVALEFKHEIYFGDELICWVLADNFTKLGFNIFYKIEIVNPQGNIIAAKARTAMLGFDYAAKKKVFFSEEVSSWFGK